VDELSGDLRGKVVLVTGGTQGIGLGVARAAAQAGARVVVVGRDKERRDRVVAELSATGEVMGVAADVSSVEDCGRMVAETVASFGRVDVLVNVAGVFRPAPFLDVSEDDFDYQLDINVKGTFFSSQAVARHLISTGSRGKIINISSAAGQRGFAGVSVYCTSKAAVDHLTRVMAAELAPAGINVNCVIPGNIEMPTNVLMQEPGSAEATAAATPARRNGYPDDVSNVVMFLASEAADFLHGAAVAVDGGILAAG
jgi:NAD(P)-dependent dehydrogenase (short-subunit alcohol dehydrogenase family)